MKIDIDLNNKIFVSISNSVNGGILDQTTFEYYQEGRLIWAEYNGGSIVRGNLIGKFVGRRTFKIAYHHLNINNELLSGKCTTKIEFDDNGRIILNENWQWTSKDYSKGESKLIDQ